MKQTITFLFTLVLSCVAHAQLGSSRADLIKEYGYNYSVDTTSDGYPFISYNEAKYSEESGNFTQSKSFYFRKNESGAEVCNFWRMMAPSTEVNGVVKYYKSKYVEIGERKWKDYNLNTIYSVTVKDGYCISTIYFDK